MPKTSRVLASLTLSSLMRHHRSCCFRRFGLAADLDVRVLDAAPSVAVSTEPFTVAVLLVRDDGREVILDKVDLADAAADMMLFVSGSRSLRAEPGTARLDEDAGRSLDEAGLRRFALAKASESSEGVDELLESAVGVLGVDMEGLLCIDLSAAASPRGVVDVLPALL
jgi:hypothetical protein